MPVLSLSSSPPVSNETAVNTVKNANANVISSVQPAVEAKNDCIYPMIKLDTDMVADATAARLAATLLGHILFLKNQVPFPVMQLGRIPNAKKPNDRSLKQRTELLNSFDTISSHLDTTFSALSTALARSISYRRKEMAQAHLAILVGPSIGTAKSKVILGIDGLGLRIWGTRDDNAAEQSGDMVSGDSDSEEEDSLDVPEESEDEEEEEESEESEEPDQESSASPYVSYAEEQRFLQNADRLLARTLAAADAEGKGLFSEIAPTQTHVLVRAPRTFSHPAWIPRQNVTNALDSVLADFLSTSNVEMEPTLTPQLSRKTAQKQKTDGVWITTRTGLQSRTFPNESSATSTQQESDDMIWWSWDGKLVGFSDW